MEVDPYQLLEQVVGLLAVVGTAVAFIVKLSMRVKHLEDEIMGIPFLTP